MSHSTASGPLPAETPPPNSGAPPGRDTVIAAVLLAVAVTGPLLVFLYARIEPAFRGIPFFFWSQFAMIPVAALLTALAYRLLAARDRHRRETARQSHAERTAPRDGSPA